MGKNLFTLHKNLSKEFLVRKLNHKLKLGNKKTQKPLKKNMKDLFTSSEKTYSIRPSFLPSLEIKSRKILKSWRTRNKKAKK